ncbi:MAG: hypothetical protein GY896_19670 [Gammaproteobacteria bacterium]|nr:hypothetical protein [Gammaproteobacteria bacterium]
MKLSGLNIFARAVFLLRNKISSHSEPLADCGRIVALVLCCATATACGGGGGGGSSSSGGGSSSSGGGSLPGNGQTSYSSFELLDPTPGAGDNFGESVAFLDNGNIVVTDPSDDSVVSGGGAVHLFNSTTQAVIASLYGDAVNDSLGTNLGSGGIWTLPNGNYVVISLFDDEGGIGDAGSVRLFDGTTGLQLGPTYAGDVAGDMLGSGGIIELANGNFVILTPSDNEGGLTNAGSVRLVNGATGAQVGTTLVGDLANDDLGSGEFAVLTNGNFVVASPFDTEGGIVGAGSVRLISGTTGAQIGSAIVGDTTNDRFGNGEVIALGNGNYVFASPSDDEAGVVNAGSVRLVNGTTGVQIGAALVGDVANDSLGSQGVTALSNNNFVIASSSDDEGGVVGAGSVRLASGVTGAQIGATIAGDVTSDFLGSDGVTALSNGNFVIASHFDNEGGITDAGSVFLINGNTGAQIGATLSGSTTFDQLGNGTILAFSNGNYVVSSTLEDTGGVVDAGTVRLLNGATGVQIGSTLAGDSAFDQLGSSEVVRLANGNFAIASANDDEGGIANAGSVRLVSGTTGVQLGTAATGDLPNDNLGSDGLTALGNGNFVVDSAFDDEGGVANSGSIRLLDGLNGVQVGNAIIGGVALDMLNTSIDGPAAGGSFVAGFSDTDNNAMVDSGLVLLITP